MKCDSASKREAGDGCTRCGYGYEAVAVVMGQCFAWRLYCLEYRARLGFWHGNEIFSLGANGRDSDTLADLSFSHITLIVIEHVIPFDAESLINSVVLALFFEVLKLIETVFEVGLI